MLFMIAIGSERNPGEKRGRFPFLAQIFRSKRDGCTDDWQDCAACVSDPKFPREIHTDPPPYRKDLRQLED